MGYDGMAWNLAGCWWSNLSTWVGMEFSVVDGKGAEGICLQARTDTQME